MRQVVALLLAAGRSSRYGSDKLAAPLRIDGHATTVLAATLQALQAACSEVVAVTRPSSVHADALRARGVTVIEAAHADQGMGASLAAGAAWVQSQRPGAACLVMLADLPFVRATSIAAVRDQLAAGQAFVVPRYRGERGHPVGFGAAQVGALTALAGDQGAKAVLQAHAQELHFLDIDDPGILHDVDTPARLHAAPGSP